MPYVGFSLFFKGGRRNFPVFFSSLQRRAKIAKNTKRCSRIAPFTNQQQNNEKNSRALARPRTQARRAFDLKRFALSKKITQNPGTILHHAPPLVAALGSSDDIPAVEAVVVTNTAGVHVAGLDSIG